jgi:putative methyltransferase (TIGR04325 family)
VRFKKFIPPVLYDMLYYSRLKKYGWFGDYSTWEEAQQHCTGYDHNAIVDKVKTSLLKVKRGEAVHERDSVLFDRIEYSWPVLAAVLCAAAKHNGRLHVLDFGGSLGSTYFQNRKFINELAEVRWNIVEQQNFVEIGKKYFQDDRLRFYPDIHSCVKDNQLNVVLLSSVLPYLKSPFEMLSAILDLKVDWLVMDKMPFISGTRDRITVQKVPPYIYEASYPAWFFSETKFMSFVSKHYSLVEEFESSARANIPSTFKGLIFKIKH